MSDATIKSRVENELDNSDDYWVGQVGLLCKLKRSGFLIDQMFFGIWHWHFGN